MTSVDVVGGAPDDYAVAVHFEERSESLWFAPRLLELIDHGAGTEIAVGDKRAIRTESGEWRELSGGRTHKSVWGLLTGRELKWRE